MAEPFAAVADVEDRWRSLSATEVGTATTLLADASAIIRAECPGIDARLVPVPPATSPVLDPAVPLMVVCRMVKRAMVVGEDAQGVTTRQESAGSLSMSMTFTNPMGELYLTKQERRLLGFGTARAFMVDLSGLS